MYVVEPLDERGADLEPEGLELSEVELLSKSAPHERFLRVGRRSALGRARGRQASAAAFAASNRPRTSSPRGLKKVPVPDRRHLRLPRHPGRAVRARTHVRTRSTCWRAKTKTPEERFHRGFHQECYRDFSSGAERDRTVGLLNAIHACAVDDVAAAKT